MTLEIATSLAPRGNLTLPSAPRRPRLGLVPRPRLLRRLTEAHDLPLVVVQAPAGYGKSALLAEWAERDGRPVTWMQPACDERELRPLVELAYDCPAIVIVDDAHRVDADQRLSGAVLLASQLPPGSTLALATRRPLAIPLGRLRANRLVLTIDAHDLALTPIEAPLLLDSVGLGLPARAVDELMRRTEGWPAVLYLAALSLLGHADPGAAAEGFSGADRFVAEYLEAELFSDRSADELDFLRRASLLPRLSGPLCDAVLKRHGSAALLDALSRTDVGVLPLDRNGVQFRLHRVVREALQGELTRFDPELVTRLHRRAAVWHGRHGEPEAGLDHALACRDGAAAGRMLWDLLPAYVEQGRCDALGDRLARLSEHERAAEPRLAVATAVREFAAGRRLGAERWLDQADRTPRASGPEAAAAAQALRACTGHGNALAVGAQALAPLWPNVARYLEGVGALLRGDLVAAQDTFERAGLGWGDAAPPAASACFAQLAALAADAGDSERAAEWSNRACAALDGVSDAVLVALPHAVAAEVAARCGDVAPALAHAVAAREALDALADFVPWYVGEAQIWLARAELRISNPREARALLTRAARHVANVPDAPTLVGWLHATWERADAFAAATGGDGPALTKAELRVLRFMPSHLSFREIASRLHVSTNTVRTQAMSVYRKLGVSSRSEAVSRGRAAGLLEG